MTEELAPSPTPRRLPIIILMLLRRPRKQPEFNMSYGYPAELVAEPWRVASSTAFAYKSGRRKPSKPAAKLVQLHRDGSC